MRLLPVGQKKPSDFEDGEWIEKPGFPPTDGTWLHPTLGGLPEFEFEEGHDRTKNEPPFRMIIGTHEDAHIRVDDPRVPRRHCMVFKEGREWFLEGLSAVEDVWLGESRLEIGSPVKFTNGDIISLFQPPTTMAYQIQFDDADNWYIDLHSDKDYPNKWPSKMPGHPSESPPAPEELKRLAWQTDQMRRRSEEDQVRVADWAAFSQYVKRHYHKYGIEAKPWRGSVGPPVPRPPPIPPRPYPHWIADLVASERMIPYVKREYPFKEALELSGHSIPEPLTPRAALPDGPVSKWGDCRSDCFKSGGTGVMMGDTTLYAAAMAHNFGGTSTSMAGTLANTGGATATSSTAPTGTANNSGAESEKKPDFAQQSTPSLTNPALQVSFREWLSAMEDSEFLIQYHDAIAAQFDSLRQLVDLYVRRGEIDKRFFDVVGISKLGHKRVFQKWFRDYCAE